MEAMQGRILRQGLAEAIEASMTEQERVAALMVRAREALRIGYAVLDARENAPRCECFYPDGSPRFTFPSGKVAHHCYNGTTETISTGGVSVAP